MDADHHFGMGFSHEEYRGGRHLAQPQPYTGVLTSSNSNNYLSLAICYFGILTAIAAVCYIKRNDIYTLWQRKKNHIYSKYGATDLNETELTSLVTEQNTKRNVK
jgi:hypothetical protein